MINNNQSHGEMRHEMMSGKPYGFRASAWIKITGLVVPLFLSAFALLAIVLPTGASSSIQLYPTGDAFIASGHPDQNLNGKALWVGYDQSGGYGAERALLKFAPSVPPGTVVTRALLTLWLGGTTPNASELQITAYRVRKAWDERTVRWIDIGENYEPAGVSPIPVSTQFKSYTWDITSLYSSWSSEAQKSELSILLKGPESVGQNERAFWAKDCALAECEGKKPILLLEYEALPTSTPTQTPTLTPTITPTATPEGSWVAWRSRSPILLSEAKPWLVAFDYGNCKDAIFTASLDDSATFEGKKNSVTITLTGQANSGTLAIYAKEEAKPGDNFKLSATIDGKKVEPELEGFVVEESPVYLPVIMRG